MWRGVGAHIFQVDQALSIGVILAHRLVPQRDGAAGIAVLESVGRLHLQISILPIAIQHKAAVADSYTLIADDGNTDAILRNGLACCCCHAFCGLYATCAILWACPQP